MIARSLFLDDHEMNEHLCLAAARHAGLTVARSEVLRFEDQTALVVERYDRRLINGQLRRVHQEDLAQACGVHPERKYQADGGPSVAQISSVFQRFMSPDAAASAGQRFADALAWNWLIGGTDAHAKNYSLLLSGREVRLAPLYDIASILPYPDVYVPKLKMAMKLGGRYEIRTQGRDTWMKVATELHLDGPKLVARVADLSERAPAAFQEAASAPALSTFGTAFSDRLCQAVTTRAADCLRALG